MASQKITFGRLKLSVYIKIKLAMASTEILNSHTKSFRGLKLEFKSLQKKLLNFRHDFKIK